MKQRVRILVLLWIISVMPIIIIVLRAGMGVEGHRVELLLACIAIFLSVAILCAIYIHNSILMPLASLREATNKIKEGNLDFALEFDETTDIGQLCQDFEEMRIRLKENEEQKVQADLDSRELISNISHDLKTPITSIKGYVEGIMDGVASSPEKLDKYIKTIYNKANDMDRLIDELTFYAKIDSNKVPYNFAKVDIGEFFSDCADEISLDMESKNIRFEFLSKLESDTIVIADVEQLKRVVNNILNNSIKYMDKEEGYICIRLLDEGDFVRIEMSDNGKGIAKEDLPFIFDRFYRSDSARTSFGGSGIGLSIVKKVINAHGAKIWAKSSEGLGTDIIIVFRKYQENT